MHKGHNGWWIKKIEKKEKLDAPESILYQYELGNCACMSGEAMRKDALLHYLSGMETVKAWQTQDTSRKEFYRAILLLAIGDTMEGQIPVRSKEECIYEAETVFDILCNKAGLPEKINNIDATTYVKMADVLWDYSVESRYIEDVELLHADVLLTDCLVGDLWLDDGPHGLIITEKARQSFICDYISDKVSGELLQKNYVLFEGIDPTRKMALKVHYHSGISRIIEKELQNHVEFPMFPNYRRHGKLSRCFGQNCDSCGQEKYAVWKTRFWDKKASLCLDCIKSGEAGRENKGFIYDAYVKKDMDNAGAEAILYRTPQPFNSWMNTWRYCCGKYARYVGRKEVSENEQYDVYRCRVCGEVYEDQCSDDEIKTR